MTLELLATYVIIPLLGVSLILAVIRLYIGPNLADRVVALDLMSMLSIGIVAVFSLAFKRSEFFDVAVVVALLSFMTTIAFARFLERRKQMEKQDVNR